MLGGTTFIGRRVVERLHGRGDEVLVVHRGRHQPAPWMENPPDMAWTDEDTRTDDAALSVA